MTTDNLQVSILAGKNGVLNPDDFALEFKSRFGSVVRYYDDGMGPLFVMRDSMGIIGIVRAMSWEDAYSIVEDEFLHVVPADEIGEAYGFNSQAEFEARDTSKDDSMELREGYSYQSNSTGSGIVSHDLNGEALDLLTLELAQQLELQIIVRLGADK